MNVDELRKDFPLLAQGFIYLDSATTSLTPKTVANKIVEYYTLFKANPLRSVHTLARRTEEKVNQSRTISAEFINAFPEEIVFVRNTTEGLNMVARGIRLRKNGNIVISALEHHSNYVPWVTRCRRSRREFRVVFPKKADGVIDVDDFAEKIDRKTRVVALTHVSNVLGTISPVEEIVKVAHENGAYVVLDAAQSAPHMTIDVKKLDVDFLALSGHKVCGPTGSGILYIKKDLFENIEPINYGGGACHTVDVSTFKLLPPPLNFEAGTIPFCEVMMMADGFQYVKKIGLDNILKHDRKLVKMAHELLSDIKNLKIYGPDVDKKTSIFTFNLKGIDSMELGMMLDSISQIEVRSGHMCAQVTTRRILGQREGVVRASTYFYNSEGDIEKLVDSVKKVVSAFT
jgi:cysteine desulfurase/selenocysteine lyase